MKGPLLMLAGIGLFALLDANSKLLSGSYPMAQVVSVRYGAVLLALLLLRGVRPGAGGALVGRDARPYLARALGALGASIGFFWAFRHLSLSEGYLIFFLSPFVTLALNAAWLRERAPPAAWAWSGLGFLGVLVAMAPGLGTAGAPLAYAAALVGTVGHSVVLTTNRRLRHETGIAGLLVWPCGAGVLVLGPFALAHWVPPTGADLALLLGNGLVFGGATLSLAFAFRHAPAARLMPWEYTALLWSLLLDLLLWGKLPAWTTLLGGAVVVVACLMSERAAHRGAAGHAQGEGEDAQGMPSGKTWRPSAPSGTATAERTAASGSGP